MTFTWIFLLALVLSSTLRAWLALRQIRHVATHQIVVPDAFVGKISLDDHRKAATYTIAKTRLSLFQLAVEIAALLALTLGGALQWLDQYWRGMFDTPLTQGIALIASVIALLSVVEIPLNLYRTFVIEARFGFNRMTPAMYAIDFLKQILLAVMLGLPLVFCVLWLMRQMGDAWWFYVWLVWMGFNLLVLALYPTLIAPLFNKFVPLQDEALRERIEQLLAKCGFQAKGLFVMDGSRRSSHGNAYFTGFGKTRRIVFFDTLIARLEPAEVEAVLAHELGHFKLHHVIKRVAWTFAASLALLWLLGHLGKQPWFYQSLNVATPSTAMALVLFFLVLPVFTFPLQPLLSLYSRKHEFEADRYAAAHASADDLVQALVKLYQDNAATLTPDTLHSVFYDSHPPASARIAHLQKLAHTVR
ncbi:MAG: M48 family metallopeptidase [Pseudomonadota bacterium]